MARDDRAEAELMARVAAGDHDAFNVIYTRYFHRLHRFVMARCGDRWLAEDLTQDAFLKAFRWAGRFKDQGIGAEPWLVMIARNCLKDHLKRPATMAVRLMSEPYARAQVRSPNPEAKAVLLEELRAHAESLSEVEREIVRLRANGMKYGEVAADLNAAETYRPGKKWTATAVGTRLNRIGERARRARQEEQEEQEEDNGDG